MYDYDTVSRTIFTLFCHHIQNKSRRAPSRAGEDLVGSMCHRLFRLMNEQPNLLARLGTLGTLWSNVVELKKNKKKSSPIFIQFWHFGIFWGIILIIYVILLLLLLLLLLLSMVNHNNESPWPLNQTALIGAEAGVNSSCGRSAMAWYIKADAVAAFCVVFFGQSLLADLGLTILLFGYGSIPIDTILSGMNIHLPAILMFTRGTRFWHTAIWQDTLAVPCFESRSGNVLT